MLFNSLEFLIFLPAVLIIFFTLGKFRLYRLANLWLVLASLFFYGWWNPKFLMLIIPLVIINHLLALLLKQYKSKLALTIGIIFNLSTLGYFKYANFFIDNLNFAVGSDIHLNKIILPLGISFFTFQKIAYLVDMYRGEVKEHKFLQFSLFVLFFPQLIAGPIVHHKEIIPQFKDKKFYEFDWAKISIGLTIFVLGLFKKLVIADNAATFATPLFAAAAHGTHLTFFEAWGAALSYTIQLYYDFSGYSDMAIGAARMFGVVLPINFNSPYKVLNIIEFWRRWHITLSRFLRDYVYIPLGGSRKGEPRRYINLFVTMLLAGIWHGAGWTFFIWGLLHATYLCVNHFWHYVARKIKFNPFDSDIGKVAAFLITFICIVAGWVMFRAENLTTAFSMLKSMAGGSGVHISSKLAAVNHIIIWRGAKTFMIGSFAIIWLMPNTQDFMRNYKTALHFEPNRNLFNLLWQPSVLWATFIAIITAIELVSIALLKKSEFLYFDF